MRIKYVLALCLLVGLSSSAFAASISQVKYFSGTPNYTQTLTFDKFDDQGGTLTLTAIHVTVTMEVTGGSLILDNDGDDSASGTFEFGAKGDISSTDVSLLDSSSQPVTAELASIHSEEFDLDGNVGDGSGDYDPSSPDGMQYDGETESDLSSGSIGSTLFNEYIGTDTYDIDIDADQWSDFGGVSGIEWAVTPATSSGSVKVEYAYTPEPTTMGLLGSGAALLLLRRKRR